MGDVRNLSIRTGAVRRLGKELVMYRDEEKREQEKVQKMKADNADPYDIKHAVSRARLGRLTQFDLDRKCVILNI